MNGVEVGIPLDEFIESRFGDFMVVREEREEKGEKHKHLYAVYCDELRKEWAHRYWVEFDYKPSQLPSAEADGLPMTE